MVSVGAERKKSKPRFFITNYKDDSENAYII